VDIFIFPNIFIMRRRTPKKVKDDETNINGAALINNSAWRQEASGSNDSETQVNKYIQNCQLFNIRVDPSVVISLKTRCVSKFFQCSPNMTFSFAKMGYFAAKSTFR
jgi:hypothetical protein